MSGTWLEWLVVVAVVAVAAVYSLRSFLGQFLRGEDEPTACAGCAAKKLAEQARHRPGTAAGAKPRPAGKVTAAGSAPSS